MTLNDVSWNDEMFADLREHWLNEKTAQEIASLLNEKYSKTITRNQVMARVQRLGLRRVTNQKSEEELQARATQKQARINRLKEDENRFIFNRGRDAIRASEEAMDNYDHSKEYQMPWTQQLMWYILPIPILIFLFWLSGMFIN